MRNRRGTDAQSQGDGCATTGGRMGSHDTQGPFEGHLRIYCMYYAAFMKAQRPGGSKGDLRAWGI